VAIGLAPSYAVLCAVQTGLVLVPRRSGVRYRIPAAGILVPTVAFGIGLAIVRGLSEGSTGLAWLATAATPVLAALSGRLLGIRRPWATVPLAAALYVFTWQVSSPAGEAAGVLLIGMACLALAAALAAVTPRASIEAGLVVLAIVDVILVWGTPEVTATTTTLAGTTLPHALPALQEPTFGSAVMGWLDLLAPALLGAVVDPRARVRAAVTTGLAAGAWGLLLAVTSTIPATVPVLAGLVAAHVGGRRGQPTEGAREIDVERTRSVQAAIKDAAR
jgi:hypothetical protein